jgi:Ca2+-binding RTX toxin-like protein
MASVSYTIAPGDLLWSQALFDGIQAVKAGTFDFSEAYQQFAFLILPHMSVSGAHGTMIVEGFFKIDNGGIVTFPGGSQDPGEIPTNHIIQMGLIELVNDVPVLGNLVRFDPMDVSFAALFNAPSVEALERAIFKGDDLIGYQASVRDQTDDLLHGWAGDDWIQLNNSGGRDVLYGDSGDDLISVRDGTASTPLRSDRTNMYGGTGNDTLEGDEGREKMFGGDGNDIVGQYGFGGDDELYGGTGKDQLVDGNGDSVLDGGAGNDTIRGGGGADTATGGGGADIFVFAYVTSIGYFDNGINQNNRDVVTDFISGIDKLRVIHSVLPPVTLQYLGSGAFTGADQVRWVSSGGNTTVFVNADADLQAEMAITLSGTASLQASDFI